MECGFLRGISYFLLRLTHLLYVSKALESDRVLYLWLDVSRDMPSYKVGETLDPQHRISFAPQIEMRHYLRIAIYSVCAGKRR